MSPEAVASLMAVKGIRVYKDPHAPLTYEDGAPRLYTLCRVVSPPCVLVHPSRWDEFCAQFWSAP
jgi:hypothetical protein